MFQRDKGGECNVFLILDYFLQKYFTYSAKSFSVFSKMANYIDLLNNYVGNFYILFSE